MAFPQAVVAQPQLSDLRLTFWDGHRTQDFALEVGMYSSTQLAGWFGTPSDSTRAGLCASHQVVRILHGIIQLRFHCRLGRSFAVLKDSTTLLQKTDRIAVCRYLFVWDGGFPLLPGVFIQGTSNKVHHESLGNSFQHVFDQGQPIDVTGHLIDELSQLFRILSAHPPQVE